MSSMVQPTNTSNDWFTPLLLSILAGLSTCIGAAIVFCLDQQQQQQQLQQLPQHHSSKRTASTSSSTATTSLSTTATTRKIGSKHMSFSLALAGSVMMTVSITSILPESFLLDDDIHYIIVGSNMFYQRCLSFLFGCSLYLFLSKFIFPIVPSDDIIMESLNSTAISNSNHDNATFERNINNNTNHHTNEYASPDNNHNSNHRTNRIFHRGASFDPLVLLIDDEDEDTSDNGSSNNCTIPLLDGGVSSSSSLSMSTINNNTSIGSKLSSKTFQRKKTGGTPSPSFDEELDDDNKSRNIDNNISRKNTSCCNTYYNYYSYLQLMRYMRGSDLLDIEARRKWRVTMLLLISLGVHNFPEGLAVAASALHSPKLGISTTIAIALHNIPEGIAIAIPCLAARPDAPWLAFVLASLSGLAEPFGAIVALSVIDRDHNSDESVTNDNNASLYTTIANAVFNMKNILSFVAGIMITVAVIELFPEARRHMKDDVTPGIVGAVVGAIIMIASDAYLES